MISREGHPGSDAVALCLSKPLGPEVAEPVLSLGGGEGHEAIGM